MDNLNLWNSAEYDVSSSVKIDIKSLLNGENAVIVLKNALPKNSLDALRNQFYRYKSKIETQQYVNGTLTTVGPYLAKYLNNIDEYFSKASEANLLLDKMDSLGLRSSIRDTLSTVFNFHSLNVAKEKEGKTYASAILRIHESGVSNPLHNDYIARDAKDTKLMLKDLCAQLSCVVCIQECNEGGELRHYRKRWQREDEVYKIQNGLGYFESVVSDVDSCLFKPQTGDVYLMDPTYYHEILQVSGEDRITMGFFIGFFDEAMRDGVAWS